MRKYFVPILLAVSILYLNGCGIGNNVTQEDELLAWLSEQTYWGHPLVGDWEGGRLTFPSGAFLTGSTPVTKISFLTNGAAVFFDDEWNRLSVGKWELISENRIHIDKGLGNYFYFEVNDGSVVFTTDGGTSTTFVSRRPSDIRQRDDYESLREEFIQHIRDKYGDDFEFEVINIRYTSAQRIDMEMNAYLCDGSQQEYVFYVDSVDVFKVFRFVEDDEVFFSDNFSWLFIREEMEAWVTETSGKFFDNFKVYAGSFPGPLPDDFTRENSARDLVMLDMEEWIAVYLVVASQFENMDDFHAATQALFTAWEVSDIDTYFVVSYVDQELFDVITRENRNATLSRDRLLARAEKYVRSSRNR